MQEGTTYVGLDAHQESTHGAIILASGEVVEDRFATTPEGIRRWARGLGKRRRGFVTTLGMEDCCQGETQSDPGSRWPLDLVGEPRIGGSLLGEGIRCRQLAASVAIAVDD